MSGGGWSCEFAELSGHVLWLSGRGPKPQTGAADQGSPRIVGTRLPTGRGGAVPVYATVLAEIAAFLQSEVPDRLQLRGATARQSRLYRAMAASHGALLADLGYRLSRTSLVRCG